MKIVEDINMWIDYKYRGGLRQTLTRRVGGS